METNSPQLRETLSEQLAGGEHLPEEARRRLRALTTAEVLADGAPCAPLDAGAEWETLAEALRESVRRPEGWLYFSPAGEELPVAAGRRLLRAATLCTVENALAGTAARLVLQCRRQGRTALLTLRVSGGGEQTPESQRLWLRLAETTRGACVFNLTRTTGTFAAALRLPLTESAALRPAEAPADLLHDRYSLLYLYLGRFCAAPE